MRKIFLLNYIVLFLVALLILSGCSIDNITDKKTIQDKANEEIDFLENKTFYLLINMLKAST